ncbi:MAG: YicC family protein, partial [Asticcacaulis sp.]
NIRKVSVLHIPIVIGTTAWSEHLAAAKALVEDGAATTPDAGGLLALRGVIDAGDERAELTAAEEEMLTGDVERLFDRLREARLAEGAALEAVLRGHVSAMAAAVERARELADQQVSLIRERFVRRVEELNADGDFHERVLQEAAVLAAKADVREELDRLSSHIEQALNLIDKEPAPGRKLDFLAQEFMREANTLCSKSAFIELTQAGLELKAVIDQFREQTQNIE